MYILHFFNNTKKKVIYEESTHVFNRNIMTILLEQFEDDTYTFDSISTIIINDFRRPTIEDIPINLKKLEILNSSLNIFPIFPNSIETIIINTSSITLTENFTIYPNLKELKMGVLVEINSIFPPSLIFKHIRTGRGPIQYPRIDMRINNNGVFGDHFPVAPRNQTRDEIEKQVNSLINNRQSVHISSVNRNICDSLLVIDKLAEKYKKREFPILDIFQVTKVKTKVKTKVNTKVNTRARNNINQNNNQNIIQNNKSIRQTFWGWIDNFFIYKSIIVEEPLIVNDLFEQLIVPDEPEELEELEELEEPEQPDHNLIQTMINWYSGSKTDSRLIEEITIWNKENTIIHSIHKISFSQLFEKIVRIIVNHEQRVNLTERLKIELTDSIGFCFTGRVNRMVNSLVGCVDGVKVSFSYKEQILIESQMIIKRLVDKKITFEKAKEEMREIFNDDEIRKDPLLVELEEVYIESLNDYNEEEIAPYDPTVPDEVVDDVVIVV